MSASIDTFVSREAAWHKAGHVTGKFMSWEGIIEIEPSLNYNVYKDQLEYKGQLIEQWGTFRSDNGVFLGPVGENYTCIPHQLGFEMVDALVQSTDGAHYATAGSLGKGEIVWGLADLSLSIHVGDDESKMYLLFTTSHDATISNQYRKCLERVVCKNTLKMALSEKVSAIFRMKHTKNFQKKMDDAHQALTLLAGEAHSMEEKLNFLASRRVTKDSLETIMSRLFDEKSDDNGNKLGFSTRRANTIAGILERFEFNDNDTFPEQRGTAYNLLNSFTEYTDHFRQTHNEENNGRALSAMFGTGDTLKQKALKEILVAANGMPIKERTVYAPIPAIQPAANGSLLDAVLDAHGA